jgi:hypothetical protein
MIKDTLIALIRAGDDAVAALQAGPPPDVRVLHLPEVAAAWPHSVAVGVRNGPLDRILVGVDARLAQVGADRFASFMEVFARAFAMRSPTPRTMATWRRLPAGAPRTDLNGPRCFAVHFEDARGAMVVATEIFSRGMYEAVRASGYEEELARHYLPLDLTACQTLTGERAVSGALALAGRLELDFCLESAQDRVSRAAARGIMLARRQTPDSNVIDLSLDLDAHGWADLYDSRQVTVSFGLRGRVFHWQSRVLELGTVDLVRDVSLPVVTLEVPRAIEVNQRRREFRIAPPSGIECWIRAATPPTPTEDEFGFKIREVPAGCADVDLVDLSFSGAGLIGAEDLSEAFGTGCPLEFWVGLPGRSTPLRLQAVVRQSGIVLTGRNRRQGRLGIEFQPRDEDERRSREAIEHHVMSLERQMAFERATANERLN